MMNHIDMENLFHSVDAAHIRNIGEQSISNKIQAILELVKNAYDADSPDCIVTFNGTETNDGINIHQIIIEDHGIGMTKNDLKNKLMKVGTNEKIQSKYSPKLHRRVSGEKGMGHYSVQRLGNLINIITTPEPFKDREFMEYDKTTYHLELNWNSYTHGKDFEKIANKLYTTNRQNYGTRIEISELNDTWIVKGDDNDLEILAKNLSSIILPKELLDNEKEKFVASIKTKGFAASAPATDITLFDYAPYKIHAKLIGKKIMYTTYKNKTTSPKLVRYNTLSKSTKATCGDAEFTLYWFPGILNTWAVQILNRKALNNQLNENYGVKIYNDNIRIMPYGEKDDWLGLGPRKSGPASAGMMRDKHVIGFIHLTRSNNPNIVETTSRQALEDNDSFKSLKNDFVMYAIKLLEKDVKEIRRNKIRKIIHHENMANSKINHILKIIQSKSLKLSDDNKKTIENSLTSISNHIKLEKQSNNKRLDKLKQNLETYRNLSSVGIQTLAFNHEILDPISQIKNRLGIYMDENKENSIISTEKLIKCHNNLDNILTWSHYIRKFTILLSGNPKSIKKRHTFQIETTIKDISIGMMSILGNMNITTNDPILINDMPPVVMNKASFESIIINLMSNSIRSLRSLSLLSSFQSEPRDMYIQTKLLKSNTDLKIEFLDNGLGVEEGEEEIIFDPFITSYANIGDLGTGMGLTIIKEIVENDYGGKFILEKSISEKTHPGKGMALFSVYLPLAEVTKHE